MCIFCEKIHLHSRESWTEHLVTKMGRFAYSCKECQAPVYSTKVHMQTSCKRNTDFIDEVELEVDEEDYVKAYFCTCCNYVQPKKKFILQHLENEHLMLAEREKYIIVLRILRFVRKQRSPLKSPSKPEFAEPRRAAATAQSKITKYLEASAPAKRMLRSQSVAVRAMPDPPKKKRNSGDHLRH